MIIRLLLTLFLALPVMAQFSITNNATLRVSPGGNNVTAVRGRMDRPWFSISNAVWAMQTGDRLVIDAGNYTNTLHYTNVNTAAIKVWGKTNITIEGAGPATRVFGFGAGTHWQTSNSLNVTFKNFTIQGNKPAGSVGAWVTGGAMAGSDNVGASRNIVYDSVVYKDLPNHGISTMDDQSSPPCTAVKVFNCYFENGGATSGVAVITLDGPAIQITGDFWEVSNNVITNWARGVEIWSNVQDVRGAKIQGNTMRFVPWEGITSGGITRRILGAVITGNMIEGEPAQPVVACNGMNFAGNGMEDCVIANNRIRRFSGGTGIALQGLTNLSNRVTDNSIEDVEYGIFVTGQTTNNALNLIQGNLIRNAVLGGIVLRGIGQSVMNNTLMTIHHFSNGAKAIHLAADTNKWNLVQANRIFWADIGIQLDANCRTNLLYDNHTVGCLTAITDNGNGTLTNRNSNAQ